MNFQRLYPPCDTDPDQYLELPTPACLFASSVSPPPPPGILFGPLSPQVASACPGMSPKRNRSSPRPERHRVGSGGLSDPHLLLLSSWAPGHQPSWPPCILHTPRTFLPEAFALTCPSACAACPWISAQLPPLPHSGLNSNPCPGWPSSGVALPGPSWSSLPLSPSPRSVPVP